MFRPEYVQFMKIKKNIVMDDSWFIKIIYSDTLMIMNGIYLNAPLQIKYRVRNQVFFDPAADPDLLDRLAEIENQILQYYRAYTHKEWKTPVWGLKAQFEKGFVKLGTPEGPAPGEGTILLLKISGIWENATSVGINYKFLGGVALLP